MGDTSSTGRRSRARLSAVVVAGLVAVTSACASSDSGSGATSGGAPKPGKDKTVIGFVRTSSDTYQAAWQRGMKKILSGGGYQVTFIENNADQSDQNSQVQQQVGANKSPAAWVWMPADAAAGAASLLALHNTNLPVFQVNQLPTANTQQYVTAYAGVNDVANGRASGQLVLDAKAALVASGRLKADQNAKLAVIKFYPQFAATTDRLKGFNEVVDGKGVDVVASADNAVDATTGYKATLSIIPILKSKGVDILYAQNDASASGAIRALAQSGFTPGKDVMVVGGNCRDDVQDLVKGRQFGTGLQAAELEGEFSAQMLLNYFKNPQVKDGDYDAPPTAGGVPQWPAEISKNNYLPNPPVKGSQVNSTKLWGQTMTSLCSY